MKKRKQLKIKLFGYELILRKVRVGLKHSFTDLIAPGFAAMYEETFAEAAMENLLVNKKIFEIKRRKKRGTKISKK